MKRLILGLTILLTLFMIAPIITAHVPVSAQDGDTLETAFFIEDPTKTWVIYSELHEGAEPQYFAFEIEAGTRIRMMLAIPVTADPESFQPSIALMGPGLTNSSSIPDYIEIPESSGVMIYESESATLAYEGFTPTSFYEMIQFEILAPATGEYFFAVYEPDNGGRFSIGIGYVESFTFDEWLLVPFNVMTIHQWNGQNLVAILIPMIATIVLGLAFFLVRKDDIPELGSAVSWIGVIGALLFVGSGVTIFYQIILSALFTVDLQIIISIIFGMLPILLGFFTLRIVLTENWQENKSKKVRLLVLGIIAPFLWAGLLIGPALLLLSAFIPIIVSSRQNGAKPVMQDT
ncbi:hypothetical protein E4H12_14360 [Candidatus Thorarchaeota archaeon]|nr:MAG: hypothetical protein E4H12_14360 [Candidatus Thorarchaeota archaeon]